MSLPSFKISLQCSLIPSVDIDERLFFLIVLKLFFTFRICQRFSFSEHGCGMHMVSPSEVFTFF